MNDLVLVGVMLVVCGGIGLPLAALLPRERFPWRDLVAPALGYGVLAVVVLLLYKRDVSMAWMFRAACVLAVAGYASRAVPLLRAARASSAAERRLAWLAAATTVVATLVVLAPRWSGGDQFAVFQGNHWDTHGYLESGIVYSRLPYSVVISATPEQTIRNPLFDSAQVNLDARPSVHMLYGLFSRVMPGQAYRLYYAYLVACYAQLVLVMLCLLRSLVPEASPLTWSGGALVFALGFWGQYVFDINAWSHIASNPTVLLMTGLLIHIAVIPEAPGAPLGRGLRLAAAIALVLASGLYLYPESVLVFGAAVWPLAILILLAGAIRARRFSWQAFVPLAGVVGAATIALEAPLLKHIANQFAYGGGVPLPWWGFFQGFFLGRDNQVGSGAAFAVDFAAGLFGLYFATPAAGIATLLAVALRVGIVVTIVSVLVALVAVVAGWAVGAGSRSLSLETRTQVAAWIAVCLVMWLLPIYLALKGHYWPAGKAISYASPVLMTVMALPMGFVFTRRALAPLRWIAGGFVVFQLAQGMGRIHAATDGLGIHYAAPYPSVQGAEMKRVGWNFTRLEPLLAPGTKVLLRPMDVWMEHHLMVFFWCRRVPFALSSEVSRGFGAFGRLGSVAPPWTPDVEISSTPQAFILHFRDGRPDVPVSTLEGD